MSVTFADGTTVTADLVIGADGIHSAVRRHYVVSVLPGVMCPTPQAIPRLTQLTHRMTTPATATWLYTVDCAP